MIQDQIREAVARERAERQRYEQERDNLTARMQAVDQLKAQEVMPNVRPTTVTEYAAFVRGYLEQGGTIRYVREYNLTGYYTAIRDFTLPPLFGSQSIDVLVPKGITVTHGDRGHSEILYMDGFRLRGPGLALFADVIACLERDPR